MFARPLPGARVGPTQTTLASRVIHFVAGALPASEEQALALFAAVGYCFCRTPFFCVKSTRSCVDTHSSSASRPLARVWELKLIGPKAWAGAILAGVGSCSFRLAGNVMVATFAAGFRVACPCGVNSTGFDLFSPPGKCDEGCF